MPNILRFLLPKPALFLVYVVIALTSLVIASSSAWINQYVDPRIYQGINSIIAERWQELSSYLENVEQNSSFSTVTTFIFWLIAGSLIYAVLWVAFSIVHAIFFEIKVSLVFVHPKSFKESEHWVAITSRLLLRLSALVLLLSLAVVFIDVLWPAIATSFTYGLLTLSISSILLYCLGSLLLFVFVLHTGYLLGNLVLWRKP